MLFITLTERIYQTTNPHTKLKKRGIFEKKWNISRGKWAK